jgi:hypothetical protein
MTRSPALQRMRESSKVVRHFVEEKIIEPKRRNRIDSFSTESKDFLDNLMNYIDSQKSQKKKVEEDDDEFDEMDNVNLDRQTALYALVQIHFGVTGISILFFLALYLRLSTLVRTLLDTSCLSHFLLYDIIVLPLLKQ